MNECEHNWDFVNEVASITEWGGTEYIIFMICSKCFVSHEHTSDKSYLDNDDEKYQDRF